MHKIRMYICKITMYSFGVKPKCTLLVHHCLAHSYQVMCISFEKSIQANKKLLISLKVVLSILVFFLHSKCYHYFKIVNF